MKSKQHSTEQIITILKEHEAGLPAPEIMRKHNISNGTFYRWKSKYGGMEIAEAKRLKDLEDENIRLKRLLADTMLDKQALEEVFRKDVWSTPVLQVSI